jgi:hypothetical protein
MDLNVEDGTAFGKLYMLLKYKIKHFVHMFSFLSFIEG